MHVINAANVGGIRDVFAFAQTVSKLPPFFKSSQTDLALTQLQSFPMLKGKNPNFAFASSSMALHISVT